MSLSQVEETVLWKSLQALDDAVSRFSFSTFGTTEPQQNQTDPAAHPARQRRQPSQGRAIPSGCIRAAILNFRQQEETHIMENIIYNELRSRGYNVDVGLVEIGGKDENGKFVRRQLEVDFVVNRSPNRVYIQSAFHMASTEKETQELRPLLSINDHFRKIIIVGDDIHRKEDELGVLTIGLLDFLTDKNILEWWRPCKEAKRVLQIRKNCVL